MSIAFVDRNPNAAEVERFRLALSTFGDGSGQERDADGTVRAGWRDMERVVADLFGGVGTENKDVFDVYIPLQQPGHFAGLSVKSKDLRRASAIADLATDGLVYMELCNSPAKLWEPLQAHGISEADFRAKRHAGRIGNQILATVSGWHTACKRAFDAVAGRHLDLSHSVYLVISYSPARNGRPRAYQVHSFDLEFAHGIAWSYASDKCLRGMDPRYPNEVLFDWYALSGGQLKYYPRASAARHFSPQFYLSKPRKVSISEKAARYWRNDWLKSGGSTDEADTALADELDEFAASLQSSNEKETLAAAARIIRPD